MYTLAFTLLVSGLQLAKASSLYLSPAVSVVQSEFTPQDTSFILSRHFGLEYFEAQPKGLLEEESFVGQGLKNALLLTSSTEDADVILPSSLQETLKYNSPLIDNPRSIITTYVHRARHSFSSIFVGLEDAYVAEDSAQEFVDSIRSLAKFLRETESPGFAALDASPLTEIRNKYGPFSEQYTVTLLELRSLVNVAMTLSDNLNFAYLTYSNHVRDKRAAEAQQTQSPLPSDRPAPQQPIGSISTCFTTADACTNGTSSCSGRGQCVEAKKAGRSCFVCTCGVTKTGSGAKTKTDVWVGESCEREDVSGPFVLLTGTVVLVVLLVVGSAGLLYSVGDQELPSVLMGSAVNAKRD
ncbi:hypothetical protein EYR40_006244 [Pleurotus pulmonarius]|nr:hypothetical protein EYR36_010865 [Pleurotus pulmonarius]KAF4599154.1 hypothetical protein EYR40_006244 [Pleurotus pulmonarius]